MDGYAEVCKVNVFHATEKSVEVIREQDPIMGKLISVIGALEIELRTDYFASLVRSIVGQQISVQAASAIYNRLQVLLQNRMTADALLAVSTNELSEAGLSKRKIEYIKDLARKVDALELDLANLSSYNDSEIIQQLTNVKGIGKWTAEVFLLLSLGRPDVVAVDDVGIQRAAHWLYQVEKSQRKTILVDKSSLWQPFRSTGSFYLWEAVHLGYAREFESIDELIRLNEL